LTLAKGALPWASIDPDKAIPWIEQRISLTLADLVGGEGARAAQ
jgi:exodeoxyribonuclease V alpha subunit